MSLILGIDTSNYTTSAALYDSCKNKLYGEKMLLPVKSGERGIRQSDAVFHHTRQLPIVLEKLMQNETEPVSAVCASVSPTSQSGSYMPCFLVGSGTAQSLSYISKIKYIRTTHQTGHILAAAYSAKRFDLVLNRQPFLAFHISGGTTDCLHVSFDENGEIIVSLASKSRDLKAGQAIDRTGVMLGLKFPCGKELEKLAQNSTRQFKINLRLIDGDCSLSGVENKCRQMYENGESREDISAFCLEYIYTALRLMTNYQIERFGDIPIIFAGGVMSDKIIADKLKREFSNSYFAEADFSCDNAYGICLYAAYKEGLI
ncbi:MAG: peptidase M22 [Ruminococcus sp.]|nr:peptidase M22 [Ruminococcus sp.]